MNNGIAENICNIKMIFSMKESQTKEFGYCGKIICK